MSCSWQFASKLTFSRGGHTHDLKPFHAHPREMLPGCMQLNMLSSNPTVKSLLNSAFPLSPYYTRDCIFFNFMSKRSIHVVIQRHHLVRSRNHHVMKIRPFLLLFFLTSPEKAANSEGACWKKRRSRKQFKCVTKLKLLEPQWTRFSSSLFPPVWVSNSTYVDVRARVFIRNFGLIWILGHDKIKHVLTFITYLVTYSYK